MENRIKNELKQKNKELIDIVIQKVREEYPNDVDLIGVCGSFFTGDFHEKSDLDLLIVLNNDRGHGLSTCFILDDVGYDLYGSPWTKLEKMASFEHTFVSHVIDVDIVYYRNIESKERFMQLRQKALNVVNSPLTSGLLRKANNHLDDATLAYGKMMLEEEIGIVRQYSGDIIYHLTNTVCFLNHSYFKFGVKRQLEEILAMKHVPQHFETHFNGVMFSETVTSIKRSSEVILKSVKDMYDQIAKKTLKKSAPTKGNLRGTYEEIWSNWYNKILYAKKHNDILLAFSSGVSCQAFYNEMHIEHGTVDINLMKYFDPNNLESFADAFEEAMQLYKAEYDRLQMQVLIYDSLEDFKKAYLGYLK